MWRVFGSKAGGSYRNGRDNRSKKREEENLQSGVPGVTCRSLGQCIAERYTRHAISPLRPRYSIVAPCLSRASVHARKFVECFLNYEQCLGEPRTAPRTRRSERRTERCLRSDFTSEWFFTYSRACIREYAPVYVCVC